MADSPGSQGRGATAVGAAGGASSQRARFRRAARAFLADPVEANVNVEAKIGERAELRAKRTKGVGGFMLWPPCPYDVDQEWERSLHELVGAPWPCPVADDFWELWGQAMQGLEAQGLRLGRGAFGGWGDGEPGLVRAAWCLARHCRPARIVETGVARGVTTRFVLEALARNGTGHLWSIDLPPLGDRALTAQVGSAVPPSLHDRWTYVYGSSRRRLSPLLDQLGEIDVFVYDSRHTERNVLFELDHAWNAMKPGGVLIVDDVDLNRGLHSFRATHHGHRSIVCPAEPLRPDHGRQDDKGAFAVIARDGQRRYESVHLTVSSRAG